MEGRIEVAILLIAFTFPGVATIGAYRVRYGKMPIGLSARSSATERFLAASGAALVVGLYLFGALYLWRPTIVAHLRPFDSLDREPLRVLGFLLGMASLGLTVWAQYAMGEAWRIGIDRNGAPSLVRHGPFSRIRNPIYTGMIGASVALFLMVPCEVTLMCASLTAYTLAVQARLEEDFLAEEHGDAYRQFAAETGRFLPKLERG